MRNPPGRHLLRVASGAVCSSSALGSGGASTSVASPMEEAACATSPPPPSAIAAAACWDSRTLHWDGKDWEEVIYEGQEVAPSPFPFLPRCLLLPRRPLLPRSLAGCFPPKPQEWCRGKGEEQRERREMGTIGGDEMVQWDKVDGGEVVNGGGGGAGKLEKILVSVRLRPLSEKEIARGDPAEWECINDTTIISRSTFPDRPTAPTAYSFA